ncbi:MAG: hypothetical protein HXY34_06120 [Candidatus Thorarchaeota archaeon]|nr:hypothetical protein [Candidatus Thorarchaeota archaeon]
MSDNLPERRDLIRSTVVTVLFSTVFLLLAIAFWAWSSPDFIATSPVGVLNSINVWLTYVVEIASLTLTFIFVTVTVVNLRFGLTGIRSGWTEIVIMLAVIGGISYGMFGPNIAAATLAFSLGFVAYLFLHQE